MRNIILATDLDNTLLYSHKHKRDGDVCVEWIHEKPQGYMPEMVYSRLGSLQEHYQVIPVTTRSISQYLRIRWPEGTDPEYAIAAHGAVLLHHREIDPQWKEEISPLLTPFRGELQTVIDRFSNHPGILRARIVDDAYAFIYCSTEALAGRIEKDYHSPSEIRPIASAKKVYFLPPMLHKGTAVRMLRNRWPEKELIACGDSMMDDEMLQEAETAYTISHGTVMSMQVHILTCGLPEEFPEMLMNVLLQNEK